jgi:hypothetical protein
MSRHLATVGVLVLGASIMLQAQNPRTGDQSPTMPGQITLTGCVERADQVSGSVTAGTTVDSLSFVLIKATKGPASDSQSAGTSGTHPNTDKLRMYRLDADVSKLNPHVGHKVEVTGTVVTPATASGGADPSSAANAAKVRVDRVRMLSETCGR